VNSNRPTGFPIHGSLLHDNGEQNDYAIDKRRVTKQILTSILVDAMVAEKDEKFAWSITSCKTERARMQRRRRGARVNIFAHQ
jgi:hypothetical protein